MSSWKHCIISLIDLIGIKKKLFDKKSKGIRLMRQMHQIVHTQINNEMPYHDHAYLWNDSVLLLAYVDEKKTLYEPVMREVNKLKIEINRLSKSYVICVKGKAIPPPKISNSTPINGNITNQTKDTYLKASSMALANCFAIDKTLKEHKKTWYIDSWIARHIKTSQKSVKDYVEMLPTNRKRYVHMYKNDLW